MNLSDFARQALVHYMDLKYPAHAFGRDVSGLLNLSAVVISGDGTIALDLDWPRQFSESELLERYERMPSAAPSHPAMAELSRLLGRRRLSGR